VIYQPGDTLNFGGGRLGDVLLAQIAFLTSQCLIEHGTQQAAEISYAPPGPAMFPREITAIIMPTI
jgi:hypothetical protein